jgi:hypothetical protein
MRRDTTTAVQMAVTVPEITDTPLWRGRVWVCGVHMKELNSVISYIDLYKNYEIDIDHDFNNFIKLP